MKKGEWTKIRICNRCEREFTATGFSQKYCNDCKEIHRQEDWRQRNKERPRVYKAGERESERRAYISYKLKVIDDFGIKRPAKKELARFYDINVTEGEIDRYFRKLIDKKLGV